MGILALAALDQTNSGDALTMMAAGQLDGSRCLSIAALLTKLIRKNTIPLFVLYGGGNDECFMRLNLKVPQRLAFLAVRVLFTAAAGSHLARNTLWRWTLPAWCCW
jgi:hypothetical protein